MTTLPDPTAGLPTFTPKPADPTPAPPKADDPPAPTPAAPDPTPGLFNEPNPFLSGDPDDAEPADETPAAPLATSIEVKPERDLSKAQRNEQRRKLAEENARLLKETEELRKQAQAVPPETLARYQTLETEAKTLKETLAQRQEEEAAWMLPGSYNPEQDEEANAIAESAWIAVDELTYNLGPHAAKWTRQEAIRYAQAVHEAGGDSAKIAKVGQEIFDEFGHFAPMVQKAVVDLVGAGKKKAALHAENERNWSKKAVERHAAIAGQYRDQAALIGAAREADIKANPTALNSLLTAAAKENPEYAKYLEQVREEAVLLGVGHPPINPDDPGPQWAAYVKDGKLTEEGQKLAIERRRGVQTQIRQIPLMFAQFKALWPLFQRQNEELRQFRERMANLKADDPDIKPDAHQEAPTGEIKDFNDFLNAPNPYLRRAG